MKTFVAIFPPHGDAFLAWIDRIGPFELLIVLAVLLLLFGARRLPDLARSLGRSLNEFKRGRAEGGRPEGGGGPPPPADSD